MKQQNAPGQASSEQALGESRPSNVNWERVEALVGTEREWLARANENARARNENARARNAASANDSSHVTKSSGST